jgi:2'-5' RNA ligase
MRLFLGSFLGPANQDFFGDAIAELVEGHAQILRAIPRRSAHLTYAFCAEAGARGPEDCAAAIRAVASRQRAMDVQLGGLRLITAGPIPRLIVSDVQGGRDALHTLTANLAAALQAAFPEIEWKPSREPHVTLARFRKQASRRDRDDVAATLRTVEAALASRPDRIARVDVIQSVLGPSGPVYTALAGEPLS